MNTNSKSLLKQKVKKNLNLCNQKKIYLKLSRKNVISQYLFLNFLEEKFFHPKNNDQISIIDKNFKKLFIDEAEVKKKIKDSKCTNLHDFQCKNGIAVSMSTKKHALKYSQEFAMRNDNGKML